MDDGGWNGGFPPFLLDAALEPTGVGAVRMDASGRRGRRGVDSYKNREIKAVSAGAL